MSKPTQTYTNTLSPIAKTRVLSDRNLVKQDAKGYAESDIHFLFNDDTLDNEFKILTIGSREIENPYFGGFFMFFGKFSDQYPFTPPHILAKTQGLNTRFHPNYYVNGKCCLSILGTWSGPPWTSCQNLGTTSQALKSLFINNPITQEPGWENTLQEKSSMYNLVIEYRTLEIAVLEMLENPPIGFEHFIEIMEKTFIELYTTYLTKLDNLKIYQGKTIKSPIYDIKITMDIATLKSKFITKYKFLSEKYTLTQPIKDTTPIKNSLSVNNTTITKTIKGRKAPNEKASKFEIGYKLQSTNGDKDWWIVYETKGGQKRWKKV
jgi:ubiquitin-protein ligase